MAVLSAPTNTPTVGGAVVGCTTDDTSGIAYAMARTDRQWYSVANGDSQALADADKATIIAQDITAPELVWAGTDEDLATIQLTIDGLPARLDPANPYYVGWVQELESLPYNYFYTGTAGLTHTRTGDASCIDSNYLVLVVGTDVDRHPGSTFIDPEWQKEASSTGILSEKGSTRINLYYRDMTDVSWAKPSATVLQDAYGMDGAVNGACTITADSADATALQTVAAQASAVHVYSAWVRRKTGSGTVAMTVDGSAWEEIVPTSEYTRFYVTATLTAPIIGFKLSTAGDEIEVDFNQLEKGTVPTSEIGGPESGTQVRNPDMIVGLLADMDVPHAPLVNDFRITVRARLTGNQLEMEATSRMVYFTNNTTSSVGSVTFFAANDGRIGGYVQDGASNKGVYIDDVNAQAGELLLMVLEYSSVTGITFSVNGVSGVRADQKLDISPPVLSCMIGRRFTDDDDDMGNVIVDSIMIEALT